jgi:hypothetical protein
MSGNHCTKQEFSDAPLSTNSESQVELFQLIQNFNKINIKEIDPVVLSNKREKLLFEDGFNRMMQIYHF